MASFRRRQIKVDLIKFSVSCSCLKSCTFHKHFLGPKIATEALLLTKLKFHKRKTLYLYGLPVLKTKTQILERVWDILGWKAVYYKIPGPIKYNPTQHFWKCGFWTLIIYYDPPIRLHDIGHRVTTYLDVQEKVVSSSKNGFSPPSLIGEKQQKKLEFFLTVI